MCNNNQQQNSIFFKIFLLWFTVHCTSVLYQCTVCFLSFVLRNPTVPPDQRPLLYIYIDILLFLMFYFTYTYLHLHIFCYIHVLSTCTSCIVIINFLLFGLPQFSSFQANRLHLVRGLLGNHSSCNSV